MQWTGITGSWRFTPPELVRELSQEISKVLAAGNGIVTGGALGVDQLASQQVLAVFPDGSRLRVILPAQLETYAAHYRRRAAEHVISHETAESLIDQLSSLKQL